MTPKDHNPSPARPVATTMLAAITLALAACSGGGGAVATTSSEVTAAAIETAAIETAATEAATTELSTSETMPPDTAVTASTPELLDELDDLDEDGSFDERCGTSDLGGGLIVETLCSAALTPTPEGGVLPLLGSLLTLPTPSRWDDLADVDAVVKVATRPDGSRVIIYVLGSDTLFDSGSAGVRSTAQPPLAAVVASIGARFPGRPINVRGAADSVGDPAANQTLSEQRAAAVAAQLVALGLPAEGITSSGLGEQAPVAAETNPDGSVSEIGRLVNRRVEIVVG